ncbi:hypothetical protein P167DRAFT_596468, partial [Morchella conica CCBAS932]
MGGQTVPVFELWVVAVFGMMLQLGVLLFAGFSVLISHRSSNFKKDGGTPQPYAFPLMAVGTCSLVLGMFLCSHIIDRSTTEETWEFEELKGARIKVAWLQLGGEVNDQLFDSHALFASKDRNQTNTLRRFAQPPGIKGQSSLVVLAVAASLCGFFGQFLGLRLMHWSVTASQLVITVIMTVLRAWVRRNLIHKPTNKKLEAGYELDWMAREISNCPQWTVVTWGFDRPNPSEGSLATKLVTARRRL